MASGLIAVGSLALLPGGARADNLGLSVAMTGPATWSINSGTVAEYTVTVTNNGTAAATNVVLTDYLIDKTGDTLTPSPANYTPSQGGRIVPNDPTPDSRCPTIDTVDTWTLGPVGPVDPVEPTGTIGPIGPTHPTGHQIQRETCTIPSIGAGNSVTVTISVAADLNSLVVPQPYGAMVNVATVVVPTGLGGVTNPSAGNPPAAAVATELTQ